ncbi:cytochrome c oxidase accessory protein CcoG [Pseudoalteromonas denitrificans]|uniref:Cytochrome c oxidase accessory protein FixG n=1 Tax=Pseudoalteromonas denitrificans DSM 6059 TaxID=1123010 RepID=A0A1I1UTM3_9GAMM|nr:cytochrome c oxidase accessory protein CcoG [Pseudoalteromonas denitrificans]SFD74106.1 cytochrome c oxidase accessory protein FixG [Pseudoalteromonas denitrificans DSM 6059]
MKFDIKEEDMIIKPYKTEGPIYVREQKGYFQNIRRLMSWALMLAFIVVPFIQYNGQQAVLFDVANQQFRIFSVTFWPQDFMLLAWIFMAGAFALFFVTTWLGRVWCGYICPQTVWTLAYIWVEHKIEGKRNQRIKLDKMPWSASKIQKKLLKHSIWLLMSLLTATTFMSYFIPAIDLYTDMVLFQWSGIVGFWVFLFALCTYGNAGWLREKMCIYMCPYSRFQAVMFDKDTLLVAYDKTRGESRGRRKRKDDPKSLGLGDCVDCNLCVEVCPAGIDIRNGLQYECINCALCIDACDETMDKFGYEKGLIKYTSEHAMSGKKISKFRLKLLGYGIFTVIIFIVMGIWAFNRIPLETSILRDRNALYRVNYEGLVENSYTLRMINKTQTAMHYNISVSGIETVKLKAPQKLLIEPGVMKQIAVTLIADGYDLKKKITNVTFTIQAMEEPDIKLEKTSRFYRN